MEKWQEALVIYRGNHSLASLDPLWITVLMLGGHVTELLSKSDRQRMPSRLGISLVDLDVHSWIIPRPHIHSNRNRCLTYLKHLLLPQLLPGEDQAQTSSQGNCF